MSINSGPINGQAINAAAGGVSNPTEDVADVIEGIDSLEIVVFQTVIEVAELGDAVDTSTTQLNLVEEAIITDAAVPQVTGKVTSEEVAELNDATESTVYVQQDVAEVGDLADAVDPPPPAEILAESAELNDATVGGVTRELNVAEVADLADAVYAPVYEDVADVADLADAVSTSNAEALYLAEVADLADGVVVAGDLITDIAEVGELNDVLTFNRTSRIDANEAADLDDWYAASAGAVGDSGYGLDDVWTANLSSWAMSRYSGLDIDQRDSRYAVSASGLYEVSVSYAAARIETGTMLFGTSETKRLSNVYVYGEHDGTMTLDITGDVRGAQATNTYTPMARNQSDPKAIRVSIGKGYSSNYYKVTVNTTGRAELFNMGLPIAESQRRIA